MSIIILLFAACLVIYLLGCTMMAIGWVIEGIVELIGCTMMTIWWIIEGIVKLILMILTTLVNLFK